MLIGCICISVDIYLTWLASYFFVEFEEATPLLS